MIEPETSEETPVFGMHFGDLGVIAIAALCTISFIMILALPSPMAKYERMQAQAQQAQAQAQALAAKAQKKRDIEKAVASGVVSVGLVPVGKP